MLFLLIKVFWLAIPAGFANIAPVLFRKINFLSTPIDFNKKLKGEPIFGRNKTFRGFFFGTLMAILIVYIQRLLYPYTKSFCILNYQAESFVLIGFILGFGALLGDLVKSFFKRKSRIKSGSPWIPFDQIDWIIGAMLLLRIYTYMPITHIILAIIIFSLMHPAVNFMSYLLGFQKNKI